MVGQTVTVPAFIEALIDAGRLQATLSCLRSGFTDPDSGDFAVELFDGSGNWVGGRFHGHSDPSDWTAESVTALVPPGTRSVRVSARGWRAAGTECSAYFDDFVLRLELSGYDDLELLYAVEHADVAGWTNDVSILATTTAGAYGETTFFGAATAAVHAHRDETIGLTAAVS